MTVSGLKKVPLVVRDLADEDMIKFMDRENDEDLRYPFRARAVE